MKKNEYANGIYIEPKLMLDLEIMSDESFEETLFSLCSIIDPNGNFNFSALAAFIFLQGKEDYFIELNKTNPKIEDFFKDMLIPGAYSYFLLKAEVAEYIILKNSAKLKEFLDFAKKNFKSHKIVFPKEFVLTKWISCTDEQKKDIQVYALDFIKFYNASNSEITFEDGELTYARNFLIAFTITISDETERDWLDLIGTIDERYAENVFLWMFEAKRGDNPQDIVAYAIKHNIEARDKFLDLAFNHAVFLSILVKNGDERLVAVKDRLPKAMAEHPELFF